jgi:hypothetical protein
MHVEKALVHHHRSRLVIHPERWTERSGDERRSNRAQIPCRHGPGPYGHGAIGIRSGQAGDPDRVAQRPARCRQEVGQARGLHVRKLVELSHQLCLQQADLIAILRPSRSDMERQDAGRVEAPIDDGEVVVAAEQQRCGADQNHTQRNLH